MNKDNIPQGKFISFEGGEGVGKSTQVKLLKKQLESCGIDVVLTREPGGSPGAEDIRELVLTGEPDKWVPMTEVLLFYAARVDHLERTVRPALNAGKWVITDRYADSTFAYQGAGHGLGVQAIEDIHRITTGNFWPDITVLMDADPEKGLERATEREAEIAESQREDRFEKMANRFHHDLREAFIELAQKYPKRYRIVSADGTIEDVASRIWEKINAEFALIPEQNRG